MKRLVVFVFLFFVLALSGCEEDKTLDYSDFESFRQVSYAEGESKENERYILYYYSQNCGHCTDVKPEILTFFQSFDYLNIYLIDVGADEVKDVSMYDEFKGTPSLFIIADGEVLEQYIGSVEVRSFIEKYTNFELDFNVFLDQKMTDGSSLETIEDDAYLVYYYDGLCTDCQAVNYPFLQFAYTRGPRDIYFMNSQNASHIPQAFEALGQGPALIEMSYGDIQTIYEGMSLLQYITDLENQPLLKNYDYQDFSDHFVLDYNDRTLIEESLYLEYYFSPNCGHCQSIKDITLPFLDGQEYPYYLFDTSNTLGDIPSNIQGVPTLLIMSLGTIQETFVGTLEITDFISDYSDGDLHLEDYIN